MMEILIYGDRTRFEEYLPADIGTWPVKIHWFDVDSDLEEMKAACRDVEVIFSDATTGHVTAELMDAMPKLKMVHSDGVAFNAIDAPAAARRGIYVCNCKGCNADGVAEVTVMLMLMLTRRAVPGHRAVVEGRQMEYKQMIMRNVIPEFSDYTIGMVGLGDIAKATLKRLAPFGNKIYYYAPHRRSEAEEQALGVEYLPLEELAARSDILSLHCAVTPETTGMVDEAMLSRMKPGSYLVNTSRGQLIDNEAVRAALISGHLAGAGFDTLWPEPTPGDHPLVDLPEEARDRVAYLPHLGGNTRPAYSRSYSGMWESVRLLLAGERPNNIMNGL